MRKGWKMYLRVIIICGFCVGFVLCLSIDNARADANKKEAKKHFEAGMALTHKEEYKAAAEKFERSIELYPTKNALFNLANCYKILYEWKEALETVERMKRLFKGRFDEKWLTEISTLESKLKKDIVELNVEINIDGASIYVDGKKVGISPLKEGLLLSPGEHEVVVTKEGYKKAIESIALDIGDKKHETFTLEPIKVVPTAKEAKVDSKAESTKVPSSSTPSRPLRTVGWVGIATGVPLSIAGGIIGGLAMKKNRQIRQDCQENTCPPSSKTDIDDRDSMGVASTALIASGVVLGVTGLVLVIADSKKEKRTDSKELTLTPITTKRFWGLSLSGRF
jgi:hypothetical protein